MLRDRIFLGFVAGFLAGIAMNIFSFIAEALQWTALPFWQWAAIMVLGRGEVGGRAELMLGVVTHLVFTSILGVVFVYLIPLLSSRIILFKGWLYGVSAWFTIYSVTLLFRVQGTVPVILKTVVSNFVGASIYGLVLGWALTVIDKRLHT